MKLENFIKVLEGNYYDKGYAPPSGPEETWVVDTYRTDDYRAYANHDRWKEYTEFAAGLDPRTAPKFEDWLKGGK
jgi:hypothetical protein